MADEQGVLCLWEVVVGPTGAFFQQNDPVKGGFKIEEPCFFSSGPDAGLWLLQEGIPAKLLATRKNSHVSLTGFGMMIMWSTVQGVVLKLYSVLKEGDGFVVVEGGGSCRAGKPLIEEGRRRPTVIRAPHSAPRREPPGFNAATHDYAGGV